ncbi:hypothetical protein YYC_02895 [Plasmodium yoelii 17X]|uniref:DNA-directed RNA polymerase II subunit RPB4 n=3 Tax=Plasmodium yoelii TaxID=5861 RepID=A0AAE9WX46_PLAYO|nr:DNA-directed RNA polymerase II subunit RPB4, putative [Plasmodium yoelii]ETB59392.1 hypothetical protein YYC_02895 [Plasmodium yoelii 17X]WBY58204.1 DNA-directed RNA polymerase II subunit RPB4 [Plasmodium yoelii yoelii]CDU85235.1 DNA-directed RNA polymerase II subunit RPB4, putative [Plasmodium yoelii]VTZ79130.1 DNA-directed RNA polymerase II subunit RPB4, putative [Plasmodium yoelii]|eukprot:XP_022813410.1 DNA-directed RNA polymerase II subunit RPB4, putative [Plasmodium yoelii]
MKILGKDEYITKFEAFVVIKKELEYSKNIDKYLCSKLIIKADDPFKDIYEKNFIKLVSDKILYKNLQKYIIDTNPHLISKELYNKDYQEIKHLIDDTFNKIVNFFKNISIYNIDKKEKIQMIDIKCINFIDLYVIMDYDDKKCEESKIEHILNLLKDVHITKSIEMA